MINPRAFPIKGAVKAVNVYGEETVAIHRGMTLLDYFAGQALAGIKANYELYKHCCKIDGLLVQDAIAKMAYQDAEAMLKEREKRNSQ